MKVLVNYEASEKGYLSGLAYVLRKLGMEAVSTPTTHTPLELVRKAKAVGCQAIVICNESTLRNCVPNPKATLDNYRGSKLKYEIPLLIVNKLNHIHTIDHGQWLLTNDLQKLQSMEVAPVFNFSILQDQSLYPQVLSEMRKSILTAYDIETITILENEEERRAGHTLISCASWSILLPSGEIKTYVLPMIDFHVEHWKGMGEFETAVEFLREANKIEVPMVMHNGMYDCTHSIVYHAEPAFFCLDTMAMSHAQYVELPKSLDFVASVHLPDYIQWKDDAASATKDKDIRKYWAYNAKDTWHTLRVCMAQLRSMPAYACINYADKFKLVFPALYCAFEGLRIDNNRLDEIRSERQIILDRNRDELRVLLADPTFNPGSWQQVQKYVYKVFGGVHPKIGKSTSGTDEKNLEAVGDQHPLLALICHRIIAYREAQKAIGTYCNYLQKQGRLLWSLNPFGTETERMACNSSNFWCGTQVQNIPYYAKDALIADEGFELVEIDNKQSEGRCTAYLAQETNLITALESPTHDFYKTLGTLFFEIPYEQVTDFFRNKVLKKIVHGTNYMMGANTFKENIGLKILHETASVLGYKLIPKPSAKRKEEKTILGFCKELLDKYHVPFPRVREWYQEIYHEVATTHMLKSPLGHVRYFFGDITKQHNMLRSAVAHQPQNLSVTILNKGFWRIYKDLVVQPINGLKLGDVRLKAQIHDSNFGQYRTELRDVVVPLMLERMVNPVEIHGRVLDIPLDAKVGQVWSKCKEYKAKE